MFAYHQLIFTLVFSYMSVPAVVEACSGLQTRKTCECRATYSYQNQPNVERDLNLPLSSYDDCAVNLGCDKQLDCSTFCRRQVQELLGGNQTYFTQSGQDRLCLMAVNTQSLNENGIMLKSHWTYSGCSSSSNVIISGLCCNLRCNCELGNFFN